MIVKKIEDHIIRKSNFCGELREILSDQDYNALSIAVAIDIKDTEAHYHEDFDEIYFLLDGKLTLRLFDPEQNKIWEENLLGNELCIISKGIHHKVIEYSNKNRLCAISIPSFNPKDVHKSEVI